MSESAGQQAASAPSPPAINRADGIARLMGDAALFARVLARFRKDYRHAAARIRETLAAGDIEVTQRQAHTLKGASGMIEAVPLREAAQALEQALRRGDGHLAPRLARLEHALERVLLELDTDEDIAPAAASAPRSAPAVCWYSLRKRTSTRANRAASPIRRATPFAWSMAGREEAWSESGRALVVMARGLLCRERPGLADRDAAHGAAEAHVVGRVRRQRGQRNDGRHR